MSGGIRPCSCGSPRTKAWHLACPGCWALIPLALQEEVYRLYKEARGSGDHIAAVRRCYEAIRVAKRATKEADKSVRAPFQEGACHE